METNTPVTSTSTTETAAPPKTVWPCLNYRDAESAIRFLVDAFGFEPTIVVPAHDGRPGVVEHAELRWPEGGGVMFASSEPDGDNPFRRTPIGGASIYVVTDHPDALFDRAMAAGATLVRGLQDEDYGSLGFSVRDPEGNIWSFGTYRGA